MRLPPLTTDEEVWNSVIDRYFTKESVFGEKTHKYPWEFATLIVESLKSIAQKSCSQEDYYNSWFQVITDLNALLGVVEISIYEKYIADNESSKK